MLRIEEFNKLCTTDKENAVLYLTEHFSNNKELIKKHLPSLVDINGHTESREDVGSIFRESYLKMYKQSKESRLQRRLVYGIIAYKTLMCAERTNPDCPTCLLYNINLPCCKKDNSIILCKGSGAVMDEKNQAYYFESGFVYCEEYIAKLVYNYFL